MSTDEQFPTGSNTPNDTPIPDIPAPAELGTRITPLSIEDEMKGSYLTYAMSVIVSRALPDVRDGLKPSQRRILVAMNDLDLTPGAKRVKCAKISGDTSGNYHPHGEGVVYPTLVRMAQDWNMRYTLVDKQGNFGSIAGLPPAAMRYTEARMSSVAAAMLEDLNLDTVDYVPTYDDVRSEPSVLPAKFPNILTNGAVGIAVGMATSIPPHNVGEVCDATIAVLDNPAISPMELFSYCPGPDFPTGGIICGHSGIRRGYLTGRSNIVVRARTRIERDGKKSRIIVSEIPFQKSRDDIEEKIADMVTSGKIPGIANIRNESDLSEPVRLILDIKRDADADVVLNQLYQFTPLQSSFSINLLALVDGKPRVLSFKEILVEFIRHRSVVIRRRTQFLLAKARKRKHTVEGLIIAHANIDEVIRVIRTSKTQVEAKDRLVTIDCPAAMIHRALGDDGFSVFQSERGTSENYRLTPVQADAILRMTLGHLVNLEQEKLGNEYRELLNEIAEYIRILSDEANIQAIIRQDLLDIKKKFGDKRRTEISSEEVTDIDIEDLITEETMSVSISTAGYIKRTPVTEYRAQRRGGKGVKGAKTDDEDPIQHLFIASTHDYLLFFTNKGKVYWHKVYNLPQLARDAKGRAIVNLLNLDEGEKIADCRAIRNFDTPGHFLVFATKKGLVKKTALSAYSRPLKGGLIAIKLREGDELIDVAVCGPGDELVLSTAKGMAIRFRQTDVRAMGRNTAGVKGISIGKGDCVVGMVIAEPNETLLTVCENGYGKRTPFGPNAEPEAEQAEIAEGDSGGSDAPDEMSQEVVAETADDTDDVNSSRSYRTQRRGGKGLRDIKATARNGAVVGVVRIGDEDELMIMTTSGKIQRIAASDVSVLGRNTQGVRIMKLDDNDAITDIKRLPKEDAAVGPVAAADIADGESEIIRDVE
ncbi:MAG: DNA gyrase subunit A [Thermoguttaceae bacterium]